MHGLRRVARLFAENGAHRAALRLDRAARGPARCAHAAAAAAAPARRRRRMSGRTAGRHGFPRSVLSGTPSSSKKAIASCASKRENALQRKRPLRGMFASSSSMEQLFVTLHRPLPVMFSFFRAVRCGSQQRHAGRSASPPPRWRPSCRRPRRRQLQLRHPSSAFPKTLYFDHTRSSSANVPQTSSLLRRPSAGMSALSRLSGAAMESTNEIMSLRTSREACAA